MASIPQLPLELALVEACDFQVGVETELEVNVPAVKKEQKTQKPESKPEPEVTLEDGKLLKKLKKVWPKILKEVKKQNKSLEVFLRAAEPEAIEDDTLLLKFYYRFHKEMVEEPKNRSIVEDIIGEEVAQPVRIKGIMGGKPTSKKESKSENIKKEEPDAATIFGHID